MAKVYYLPQVTRVLADIVSLHLCAYNVHIMTTIPTRLTTSGNSKAVRLPKALLKLSQLGDAVELEARPGEIVIRAAHNPRAGWRETIKKLLKNHGDPVSEFAEWDSAVHDGLEDAPWDGPTYAEWAKRDEN